MLVKEKDESKNITSAELGDAKIHYDTLSGTFKVEGDISSNLDLSFEQEYALLSVLAPDEQQQTVDSFKETYDEKYGDKKLSVNWEALLGILALAFIIIFPVLFLLGHYILL